MATNSVKAIPLSIFDAANLLAGYQVMNGTGLPQPCFFIRIVNGSDTDITVSFDGITDHEFVLNGDFFDLPTQANAQLPGDMALWSRYTKIYIKGTAGNGDITLSGYYT